MTFNETNVNRDQAGKFDTKTGAPAEAELTTSAADDRYTAAYAKYWEQTTPALTAAQQEAQAAQLGLVDLDISQARKGIVRAEVQWDDEMEALGRPHRFYDAEGNEVDLGYETNTSLDMFDDHDSIRYHHAFTETENGFSFNVADAEASGPEIDEAYNHFWGHSLDRLNAAKAAVQEAQFDLVRAEIGLEDQSIVSAEVDWDDELGALGRPSRFFDANGEEVYIGVETDTALDMFDDFDEVRRDDRFTLEGDTFRFNINGQ